MVENLILITADVLFLIGLSFHYQRTKYRLLVRARLEEVCAR